jgi:O-methyltransferase involved in polyketide biosynthesis
VRVVEIDMTVPHPARVYDYCLGGKDNYEPDRVLARAMIEQMPSIPVMARANRDFLGRTVRHLVSECGITQFLDVGAGIPTAPNAHQVAQGIDPAARVVYVDNDPIVLAHSRALLTSTPEGRTAFIAADATKPEVIIADPVLWETLDRDRPIGLMLISMLMYFPGEQASSIASTLLDALPSGSYVTISHPTAEFNPADAAAAAATAARGGVSYYARTRSEVESFFDGLTLVEPGVVPMLEWRPPVPPTKPHSVDYWVGMARKN